MIADYTHLGLAYTPRQHASVQFCGDGIFSVCYKNSTIKTFYGQNRDKVSLYAHALMQKQ